MPKKLASFLLGAAFILALPEWGRAESEFRYLSGAFEPDLKVGLRLRIDGKKVEGDYFNWNKPEPVALSGKLEAEGRIELENPALGRLEGTLNAAGVTGKWSDSQGKISRVVTLFEVQRPSTPVRWKMVKDVEDRPKCWLSAEFPQVEIHSDPKIAQKLNQYFKGMVGAFKSEGWPKESPCGSKGNVTGELRVVLRHATEKFISVEWFSKVRDGAPKPAWTRGTLYFDLKTGARLSAGKIIPSPARLKLGNDFFRGQKIDFYLDPLGLHVFASRAPWVEIGKEAMVPYSKLVEYGVASEYLE